MLRAAVPALGLLTTGGGCDRPAPGGASGAGDAAAVILADAPAELPALLDWAVPRVAEWPAAAPLPDESALGEPRMGIFRFSDELWRARVTCDWKPVEADAAPLAALGPFRSDRPSRQFLVQQQLVPEAAGVALGADIAGFRVNCEEVGSIALELRIPFGRHFDLIWSRAGRLRVPLPDNERFWKLTLPTDNFAEWSGPLEKLSLLTDGVQAGVIELKSLRFLRRERSFLRPVGVRRVDLDREARSTVYMHTPAAARFEGIHVPPEARLHLGLACIAANGAESASAAGRPESGAATGSARFEIEVSSEGRETTVLDEHVSASGRWEDRTVDLSAFSGKRVSITLRATSPASDVVALWSDATLYEPQPDPPLVIVYLIDTLAGEHIHLYGYPRETMPRLRTLASAGVWFADMFANSPRTLESVPNLLFGLSTERHGVINPSVQVPQALVSLPEALRATGFATASFCTNVNAGPRQALDQGFDSFFDRIGYAWSETPVDRTVPIEDALRWIENRRDRPVFIYIHTAEPHAPYTPPPGFAGRFSGGYSGPIDGTYDKERGFRTARSETDIAHVRGLYDEEIVYADARLGLFLDALATAGLRERLTIFITADHGEEFLQHGAWEHGENLFVEVLRVPLVVTGAGVAARGRSDVPAQLLDVMPTILDMHGVPHPYELNGASLWPLLDPSGARAAGKPAAPSRERVVFSANYGDIGAKIVEWSAIEAGRWKLLYNARPLATRSGVGLKSPHRFALFDLHADRAEQQNVIDEHPDVARRLIGQLIAWRRANPRFESGAGDERELDARQLRELQSLGYIGD